MRLGATLMTGPTMRRLSTALAAAFISAALPSVSSAADLRVAHTSTLLPSGDILIAGGIDETGATLQTADLFEASLGNSLVAANSMSVVRASHTATLLSNGCVLAVGGNAAASDAVAPSASASAEIYNTATGLWVGAPSLTTARYNHTATLLNSGVVLICGGQDSSGNALASCEFYTPTSCTTGSFGTPLNLLQGRYNHTATLLKDGKVWFAGGINPSLTPPAERAYLSTTERYNPASNAFQSAPPLIEARAYHTATMMGDGKVLVVGGYNSRDFLANGAIPESAAIYDPVPNTVSPAAVLSPPPPAPPPGPRPARPGHRHELIPEFRLAEVAAVGGVGRVARVVHLVGVEFEPRNAKAMGHVAGARPLFLGIRRAAPDDGQHFVDAYRLDGDAGEVRRVNAAGEADEHGAVRAEPRGEAGFLLGGRRVERGMGGQGGIHMEERYCPLLRTVLPGSCETGPGTALVVHTRVPNKGGHGVRRPLDGPALLGRSWFLTVRLSEVSRATLGPSLDLCRPPPPR